MKNRRLIKSGGVAKRLMMRGHLCIDTAPQRDDPSKSLFIFFADRWLNFDIDEIMKNSTMDKSALQNRLAALGLTEKEYRKRIFEDYLESESNAEKAG